MESPPYKKVEKKDGKYIKWIFISGGVPNENFISEGIVSRRSRSKSYKTVKSQKQPRYKTVTKR